MSRKVLLAAVSLTVTAVAVGVLTTDDRPSRHASPGLRSERSEPRGLEPVEITAAAAAPAAPPPVEVLRSWDARRSAAWARGDPSLLRPLYTPHSTAGAHDRAMLRAWQDRGLVVRGLETQLLSVRELGRSRRTWTLLVTDRVVGGVATGDALSRRLPLDRPTTRTVRLRLVDGRWRVAAVRPVAA